MGPDAAVLEARAINAWRGDRHILKDVSFELRPGEFMKLTGPNGVGKTTLIRVVCGLLPAESGEIIWKGKTVRSSSEEFHEDLAYLGHPNALKADLSARENLRYLAGLRRSLSDADIDRPPVSSGAWRWRACCWPRRGSGSWTNPLPTSTWPA